MATQRRKVSIAARLKGLLIREDWIYLLSLLVPVFVYNVALKVVRVATQFEVPSPLGFVDQVRSDLLFNLGYTVLWIGLFAVVRGGVLRLIALVLCHVSVVVVIALSTIAHAYFEKTGSTLGLDFLLSSLSSITVIWKVLASETTVLEWILLGVALLYGIFGPTLITRFATHGWHLPTRGGGRAGADDRRTDRVGRPHRERRPGPPTRRPRCWPAGRCRTPGCTGRSRPRG